MMILFRTPRLVVLNLFQLLPPASSFTQSKISGFVFAGSRTTAAAAALSRFGSIQRPFHSHGHKMTSTKDDDIQEVDDPYIFLEEVESEESIAFAKMANEKCLARLGDPSHTDTYKRVLGALESNDR